LPIPGLAGHAQARCLSGPAAADSKPLRRASLPLPAHRGRVTGPGRAQYGHNPVGQPGSVAAPSTAVGRGGGPWPACAGSGRSRGGGGPPVSAARPAPGVWRDDGRAGRRPPTVRRGAARGELVSTTPRREDVRWRCPPARPARCSEATGTATVPTGFARSVTRAPPARGPLLRRRAGGGPVRIRALTRPSVPHQ